MCRERRALQIRAESEQAPVAILYHELARLPWHVANFAHNFHAVRCILRVKRVRVFDKHIGVEKFVIIFGGIVLRWLGTAEVDGVLISRNDGIEGRILPRAQTLEPKLGFVVSKSARNIEGEELGGDQPNHRESLHRMKDLLDGKFRTPKAIPRGNFLRFNGAVERDPAIDAWMRKHAGELGSIAQRWFE